ncbi:MAG: Fic family protein [Propionivibrio sp.]|uniref:Fic family protein n=1 Tax=Candidatus Propionivibrio dominans TaxID=2954373 RepID=A0A9D7FGR5_9RHOO|nr:Fic family protein [Candidatus Propionivibrio dominans]MBL0167269.1 Fic family protein [Propionivibrio sp.]
MNISTLKRFTNGNYAIHPATAWYLSDLGEFHGKQELYTRQSPQRLKALREHALIESAVSSNRIEGVSVESSRVRDVLVSPEPLFRDRDEEEVRGYRDALTLIHQDAQHIPVSNETIQRLHAMTRGQIWDAGLYKEKDSDIIERYPDGRGRVRFCTVPAKETPAAMTQLGGDWQACLEDRWVPPLIALAAFNLDFLCIHPFRDGNGRVSRLLWLLQSYQLGIEVGRYISLERLVEQHKDRYYETLAQSSQGWHEGKHDPWLYIKYVLFIFKTAYREFVERVGETSEPRGSKTQLVLEAISKMTSTFSLTDLERACPGVSRDMIRRVLTTRKGQTVDCIGRGPGALWQKRGN